MLVAELAAACKLDGMNLAEKLDLLYRKYGFYQTKVVSVELDGEAGKKLCADFIDTLRNTPPASIAALPVESVADYKLGRETDCVTGEKTVLDFPSSNVLSFLVGGCCRVILRPSGTEPKLKIYASVSAADKEAAEKVEAEICKSAEEYLK